MEGASELCAMDSLDGFMQGCRVSSMGPLEWSVAHSAWSPRVQGLIRLVCRVRSTFEAQETKIIAYIDWRDHSLSRKTRQVSIALS